MKAAAKSLLKRLFGPQVKLLSRERARRSNRRGIASFGQEGEDRVLASLLFKLHGGHLPATGFYIDIGAHDPFRFSNTYAFYTLGWSGLNIDAAPGSMRDFDRFRPRDINVEVGIGRAQATAIFHVFDEPALSTFDATLARERAVAPRRVIAEVPVAIAPAAAIFGRYLAPGQRIDFLTIDVEGLDLEVLASNDWRTFRPMIVAVEIYGRSVADAAADEVALFLGSHDYLFYSKTVNTGFFVDAAILRVVDASGS